MSYAAKNSSSTSEEKRLDSISYLFRTHTEIVFYSQTWNDVHTLRRTKYSRFLFFLVDDRMAVHVLVDCLMFMFNSGAYFFSCNARANVELSKS